jgi:hypothetical protein
LSLSYIVEFEVRISLKKTILPHETVWNLPIIKRVAIENKMFNLAMQFKFVSDGFTFTAYYKNELHDMKNESNELNVWRFGYLWSRSLWGSSLFLNTSIEYINYFDLLPIQGLATSTTFVKVTVESVNTFTVTLGLLIQRWYCTRENKYLQKPYQYLLHIFSR